MACNATELIAAIPTVYNLGGEGMMLAKLSMLRAIVLQINPAADVSPEGLVAAGTANGYDRLAGKWREIAKLELLCQISEI